MKIETKYSFGDIVFLITDQEQCERMVTGIFIRPDGLTYELSIGDFQSNHYEIEISDTVDIKKLTSN